jgi:hypothetical protein
MRGAGHASGTRLNAEKQSRDNGAAAHAGPVIQGVMDGSEKSGAQRVIEVCSVLRPLGQLRSSVAGGAQI